MKKLILRPIEMKTKTRPTVNKKLLEATMAAFEPPRSEENIVEILNDGDRTF